jgi:hypothetical protein
MGDLHDAEFVTLFVANAPVPDTPSYSNDAGRH